MGFAKCRLWSLLFCLCPFLYAQQPAPTPSTIVPQIVNYSGKAADATGHVINGIVGMTFSIYKEQYGGPPLWTETQNIQLDYRGDYTVQLGASTSEGLPLDVFTSGEARWLGVRINGGEEQPRVMLLSVPYALKAGDAATVGGLPPSAFVLATPAASTTSTTSGDGSSSSSSSLSPTIGGSGTLDYLPLWTPDGNTLGNSVVFQSGSGSTAKIGINTTTPASMLDINGGATVRGALTLPSTGSATATTGKNSQPEKISASSYNSSTKAAVGQSFQWQAEPSGNDTSNPSGTLNLLFGSGGNTPTETGLHIASNGTITFVAGQTFPGTGTISGITAGTDLTGGGTSGNVTLNVDTTKVPQLNAANTFTGNQTVNGNVTATGVVSASSYQIGSNLFDFGSYGNGNAFLGFAGNATTRGPDDTGIGIGALASNTTGTLDTATGAYAMLFNTTGSNNTATGMEALYENTTGYNNTGNGTGALFYNSIGTDNTGIGYEALYYNTNYDNTALGSQALYLNTQGYGNTGSGYQALYTNQLGSQNTATGSGALYSNTATENTANGYNALYYNTTGYNNTATGAWALSGNTTGVANVATGASALESNSQGNENTADGDLALNKNTTGYFNTAVGYWSLFSNTTGYENTGVGVFALNNSGGNDLTCIGYNCQVAGAGLSNATAIGAHAVVKQSNSLVLGGTGEWGVKVGIGTETPSNVLTIARGAGHPVSDSWETYSSRRWKTNIKTLPDALTKVELLRGVSYQLKDSGRHEIGVIAEEVGAVVPEVVSYEANGKDASGVDYSRLTALLIEAIKQQQKQVASERRQIVVLREQIRKFRNQDHFMEGKLTQLQGQIEELRRAKYPHAVPNDSAVMARAQP